MLLPAGTKVNLFEKDGFETVEGIIVGYEGEDTYIIKSKLIRGPFVFYKIKKPKIDINLTTKGNSLEKYRWNLEE